ncbi:MAG: cell division topological specificity factor MinE [Chloroflexi bacterium]|nr:cell division topological specificity factor MinE [Chloroflexota bacterium]MBI5956917.1 cell division topological specificity factor MinE [Chloroflexota bacterium]
MKLFGVLFGRTKTKSSQVAKERLKLVLVHDRIKVSPELLDTLKGELIGAISKHIDIDQAGLEVTITRGDKVDKLVANIPIRRSR